VGKQRKREAYRNGDVTLGERDGEAVAAFGAEGARKRIRLGVRISDEAAAKAALDRFADARRAVKKQQESHTCGKLWELWLAERSADKLSNATYEMNWQALKPHFANRQPLLLSAQDFRDYALQRFALGRSSWTVHTELVRLRACLKWAAETHLIERRPKVWVPRPGASRERVLSNSEARLLVAAAGAGDPHISLFVLIAFATGARHMAILDLTWDRIDFAANTIQFDEDVRPDPMSKAWKKGRATVPMGSAVRAALQRAHAGRTCEYVIEHGGRRLKSVREGFANAVARAGLAGGHPDGPITPHIIRHTVVTWLDAREIATKRTAQLVGHKDERTTKKVYTHASHELLREAVDALDEAFAPLPRIDLAASQNADFEGENRSGPSQRDEVGYDIEGETIGAEDARNA